MVAYGECAEPNEGDGPERWLPSQTDREGAWSDVPLASQNERTQDQRTIFQYVQFANGKEILKLAAPLVVMALAFIQDTAMPAVYPEGYVEARYPAFLMISLVIYLVCAVLSVWFKPVRSKVIHFWGLLIVAYGLLMAYNYNTVKTGNLLLPVMPSPDAILNGFFEDVGGAASGATGGLFFHFMGSFSLLLQGVAFGFVAGMVYGTLMGYSRFWNYWLQPIIKIIGPVPSTAWMAIAMVLAPSSHTASVFLVSLTTWFPLSVNLSGGIRGVPKAFIERAETMGASPFYIIRHIIYPAVLPNIFTGLFMGLCFSLTALVTAEALGVEAGLGWVINHAQGWNEFDLIFSSVIVFILMAFVLLTILFKVQKHCMKWSKGAIQW